MAEIGLEMTRTRLVFNPMHPNNQYAYFPHCLNISQCADGENLFDDQEPLKLVNISFILVT